MASLAQNLAQIRRRAKGEVRRIEAGISAAQASGNKNEEAKLTWRREFIQEGLQASYLKGKTGTDRLDAVQAAYALRGPLPEVQGLSERVNVLPEDYLVRLLEGIYSEVRHDGLVPSHRADVMPYILSGGVEYLFPPSSRKNPGVRRGSAPGAF